MLIVIKRLLSDSIDYIMILFVFLPISWLYESIGNYQSYLILMALGFKDMILKNKSICKRIFNLEVLTIDDKIPSKFVLFFRNMTMLIWPIEIVLVLFKNKRIGDIIFKTKVVEKSKIVKE